jgi:hypothetical protein
MLCNEKYAGTFVYCRSTWPLGGGRTRNSPNEWVRVEGAIDPIIDRDMFATAQSLLNRWAFTNNELLYYLTAAWCTAGYLSAPRLNRNKFVPTPVTYRARFGSLSNAYRLVGYRAVHAYMYSKDGDQIRRMHHNLICRLTSTAHYTVGMIIFSEDKQVL